MSLQDELRVRRDGAGRPPTPMRWDLVAFWAIVVGPGMALALWAAGRQWVGDLEERLVRDANAAFLPLHVRPVHADEAVPGAFGDAVARHLPRIHAEARAVKDEDAARETARAIVAGQRSVSDVPASYARALDLLGPDLDGLLRGTRAASADLPATREAFVPHDEADWIAYQFAALLSGLRTRLALAAGRSSTAAAECLDGLALGRDAAISAGAVGQMVGAGIFARLVPPCADALGALETRSRLDATRRVRAIRDAVPAVPEMLRIEFLAGELLTYGPMMSRAARDRLAPAALPHVRSGERAFGWWESFVIRDAWRGTRQSWDALLRAARSKRGGEREEAFAAIDRDALRRVNPIVAVLPVKAYGKFARHSEAGTLRLDALVLAASAATHRNQTGAWPATSADLAARGLLREDEASRLAAAQLAVHEGGDVFVVIVPLPQGSEKDPPELRLRVRARMPPAAVSETPEPLRRR